MPGDITNRPFVTYFATTTLGLFIDFGTFQLLLILGTNVAISNFASTGMALVATYVLSSRFVFKTKLTKFTLSIYFIWYSISNTAFSLIIDLMVRNLDLSPLIAKALILPLSFLINYLATREIFVGRNKIDN